VDERIAALKTIIPQLTRQKSPNAIFERLRITEGFNMLYRGGKDEDDKENNGFYEEGYLEDTP
jgi:hypothetical protein